MIPLRSPTAPHDASAADGAGADIADRVVVVADTGFDQQNTQSPNTPIRPQLVRNQASQPPPAVPPPPTQPTPGPDGNGGPQQPPDSLSLAQLRRLVADMPRSEAVAYDFVYEDMGPLDEEIDEWFVYHSWQEARLDAAQKVFEDCWERGFGRDTTWEDASEEARNKVIAAALRTISTGDPKERSTAIATVLYIVLGRYAHTASSDAAGDKRDDNTKSVASQGQLDALKAGTGLLAQLGSVPIIWKALRNALETFWGQDPHQMSPNQLQEVQDEVMNLMTIMYIMIQECLSDPSGMAPVYTKLLALNPSLTDFMMNTTARLRWDEASLIPHGQVFLLFWKSLLLVFGGTKEIEETKKATRESDDGKEKEKIMASPLDYHVFRQEISSKYPAYIPPQLMIPLEAEHTSILPPLPNHPTRNNGANGILPLPQNAQAGGASILHQPVHIATPAPSPPPSPAIGGKGSKKQNYQTNQNFPFMYPPLDATSNSAGGKGPAGMQDALVGRKWEGSDIPASILEAGELFANRVRMSRATRQLWDERERFLKFERGWDAADSDILDELDLSSLSLSEKEELGLIRPKQSHETEKVSDCEVDYGPQPNVDEKVKQRLDALEVFYEEALPQLQSLVIVLLKAILMNVAILMAAAPPGQQHPVAGPNNARLNGPAGPGRGPDGANGANANVNPTEVELSPEELDAARTREINTKAVSGIMLLLLKWLKVSHVLKFEYLTQLLLDCNYVPLLLKLWAHQDVQQLVESKADRIENSFFYFCNVRAGAPERPEQEPEMDAEPEEESEDEAAPPPIKRRRSPSPAPVPASDGEIAKIENPNAPVRPEVDELGYPVNPLPQEPITDFSRRNFFSLINLLRVMQKICKHKAHRNLHLVHYKSSNILRKMLKVPQQELRLYTLKLFKNQVPYCGRKWRQGNMRVITAVYLHCRPELRDEWLAGSDVDAEVEEALPLEQALRSVTHWFNVRRYPDKMAPEVRAALRDEQDFFSRELDRFSWADVGDAESILSDWDGMPG